MVIISLVSLSPPPPTPPTNTLQIITMLWNSLSYIITYYGLGSHLSTVPLPSLIIWAKIYYVALCSYLVVSFSVKASLLTFLMRIFPHPHLQKVAKALFGFLAAFTISNEFLLAFQCRPVRVMYDITILPKDKKCWSADTLFSVMLFQGILMFVTDIVIMALPMPLLWRLKLPLRQRLQIVVLFGLGALACVASLVRFSTLAFTKDETDFTYSSAKSLIWMCIEFNASLLAGSLPSLRLVPGFRALFGSSRDKSAGYTGPSEGKGDTPMRVLKPRDPHGGMGLSTFGQTEIVGSQERIIGVKEDGESSSSIGGGEKGERLEVERVGGEGRERK